MTTKEIVEEHMKTSRDFEKKVLSSPEEARKFLIRIGVDVPKTRKPTRSKKKR
ncbi:MAG TPA: hypothetical protein VGN88_08105 [Phycisphaerae bacterium]|jgi:hypothetical protein